MRITFGDVGRLPCTIERCAILIHTLLPYAILLHTVLPYAILICIIGAFGQINLALLIIS